ncbi:MAG: hypothetical protein AAF409_17640 [Pseudomonadota bacterium]
MRQLVFLTCLSGLLAAALPAQARTWKAAVDDAGRIATAWFATSALTDMRFLCSLPGYDPMAWGRLYNDMHPPSATEPGTATLELGLQQLPGTQAYASALEMQQGGTPRLFVRFNVDGEVAATVEMRYDTLFDTLFADIALDDPLLGALKAGSRLTVLVAESGDSASFALRGSSRSITVLEERCPRTATAVLGNRPTPQPDPAAQDRDAVVWRDMAKPIAGIAWVNVADSNPEMSIAFVELPSTGGNAIFREVFLYRNAASGWERVGKLNKLFGSQPRDAVMRGGEIEIVTTALKDGEPRCCPTGIATYRIDPDNASLRRTSLE